MVAAKLEPLVLPKRPEPRLTRPRGNSVMGAIRRPAKKKSRPSSPRIVHSDGAHGAAHAGRRKIDHRLALTRYHAFKRRQRETEDPFSFRALAREIPRDQSDRPSTPGTPARAKSFRSFVHDTESTSNSAASSKNLTRSVNKRIRKQTLRQDYWTNRFQLQGAEEEYHRYVSLYQLQKVRRRVLLFGIIILCTTPLEFAGGDRDVFVAVCRSVAPGILTLAGTLLLFARRTKPWWRLIVMELAKACYVLVLCAELLEDVAAWNEADFVYSAMWQLLWLILAMHASGLALSLDFVYVAQVLCVQWGAYVIGAPLLHLRWSKLRPEVGSGEAAGSPARSATRVLAECLATATCVLLLLLLSIRRINRFERQTFVNSYVLLNKVGTQVKTKTRCLHLQPRLSNTNTSNSAMLILPTRPPHRHLPWRRHTPHTACARSPPTRR